MKDTPDPRYYLGHVGIGMAPSAMLMAAILRFDPMGLGTLLLRSGEHPLPLLLLSFFCELTFASVQLGIAIMLRLEP